MTSVESAKETFATTSIRRSTADYALQATPLGDGSLAALVLCSGLYLGLKRSIKYEYLPWVGPAVLKQIPRNQDMPCLRNVSRRLEARGAEAGSEHLQPQQYHKSTYPAVVKGVESTEPGLDNRVLKASLVEMRKDLLL